MKKLIQNKGIVEITVLIIVSLSVPDALFSQSILKKKEDHLFSRVTGASKKHNSVTEENLVSQKKKKLKGFLKSDSPDLFVKFRNMIRTGEGESSPSYKPNYLIDETRKALKNHNLSKKAHTLDWIERGPGNVSGRTRGIIVDFSDPSGKTWFAGSAGGGIWMTSDMGKTWLNKTNDLPNLSTSVLVQSPSNPDIFYCGTGEGFYNADAVYGSGIFKSTDHGNTWLQLTATANFNFYCVNRMIIDPDNPDIVLACTNPGPDESSKRAGVYRSTDGGTSWKRVMSAFRPIQDLKADPDNFSLQYAAVYGEGVFKSTNAGLNWKPASYGLSINGRSEIAISPNKPRYIYVSAEVGSGSGLFLSKDSAATWNKVKSHDGNNYNWLGSQGWYDNTIAVHPYDGKTVFFAGIDMWKAEIIPSKIIPTIVSIDQENTSGFISFFNWNGDYNLSGIGLGKEFFNTSPFNISGFHLENSDYVSVELRFGPGKKQKAHRFVMASNGQYNYRNYVDVPFEVWDVTNNRQIMVSFRDTKNDGAFDLKPIINSKEYIIIHSIPYNPEVPDASVAVRNGVNYKNIYVLYPFLAQESVWDPVNLPESKIRITTEFIEDKIPTAKFYNVTDGYGQYSKPYVHVDHHNIVFIPKSEADQKFWILNCNDGGVAISTDQGNTWTETLSGGYNTTQFYGVDKKPGLDEYIGGTQDNGTWLSPMSFSADKSTSFRRVIGGDGFETAWNYQNSDLIIGGSQFNYFMRSTDAGVNWSNATGGLNDVGNRGAFISRVVSSQSDPHVIFTTGKSGVWRSEDFGASWRLSDLDATKWDFNGLSAPIAISIADPQYIWAGSYFSNTESNIFLSDDGGISFKVLRTSDGVAPGTVTNIETHPLDYRTAYLTFSVANAPKILRTTDLGDSWEDLSGFGSNYESNNGFPNVATHCVVVMPYNPDIIWAGTEIGLFESVDNGKTWHYTDTGLPAVSIWDMKIVDDQIVMATHGRGIFSVSMPELRNYKPPVVILSPILKTAEQSPDGSFNVQLDLRSSYDSSVVYIDGILLSRMSANIPGIMNLNVILSTTNPTVRTQVYSYKNGKVYKTSVHESNVLNLKQPVVKYINDFNSSTQDFVGNGFRISSQPGFSSDAIHSQHPYDVKSDYYFTLTVPIIVAEENAFIEYDDIAIVEPEDDGYKFGEEKFWDYVVIEGNKDGLNWIPLSDGYKSTLSPTWHSIWNSGTTPDGTSFVHHKINLHDKFPAGEKILLRLHLYSDEALTGWGWVVDNLVIQNDIVSADGNKALPSKFNLSQNFPNPFNPATIIRYDIASATQVMLKVYDVLGNEVSTLVNKQQNTGSYEVIFDAKGIASGNYFYVLQAGKNRIVKKMMVIK